jgi:hypothetical protein
MEGIDGVDGEFVTSPPVEDEYDDILDYYSNEDAVLEDGGDDND